MTKKTKKIIVNMLSLTRILVAGILPFIMFRIDTIFLLVFLAILLLTDSLDGFLARRWGVSTVGGSLLDPIGDKVLAFTLVLSLAKWNKIMIVLFILELIISIINIRRVLVGIKTSSTIIGKIKTWFLGITIMLIILNLFFEDKIKQIILIIFTVITILFELVTIISYLVNDNRQERHAKNKLKSIKEILKRLFDEEKYQEDIEKPLIELIKK